MKTLIDNSRPDTHEVDRKARQIIAGIFMIVFLASLGYWAYAIYEIYNTNIKNITTFGEVWHYIGHHFVAFEAALLSIIMFYITLKT